MASQPPRNVATALFAELDGAVHVGPAPGDSLGASELAVAVRAALEAPLGYPALAAATVPGDVVAVALEAGLPQVRELVSGVLAALQEAGVDASHTTFLYRDIPSQGAETFADWAAERQIYVERHDPGDESCCAMFGVSQAGHPLRVNRVLSDADIVLPIDVAQSPANATKFAGFFPEFSDEETIVRHRGPESGKAGESWQDRRQEVEESGWLLGVGMAVQVVPGPDGGVAAVFAGDPDAVVVAAAQKYRDVWERAVPAPGDLVVAIVSGPANEQTWENLGRAIQTAEAVLEPGGAIAICTQLAATPGPALKRLAGGDEPERLERKLERDSAIDAGTALIVCRALQRGPVYLQSRLRPVMVENLGFAPIANEAELARLVKSHRRPLVLTDAHRLVLKLAARPSRS